MEEGPRLFAAVRHLFPAEEGSFRPSTYWCAASPVLPTRVTGRGRCVVLATRLNFSLCWDTRRKMSHCAKCGCEDHLYGFSPSLGGMVCKGCVTGPAVSSFAISDVRYRLSGCF
jgi:hypothetical protein